MTGKELMLALVGAGLVGGAAGAAASLAAAPKAEPVAQAPSADLLDRLQKTEDELTRTRAALTESRNSINALSERVASAEIQAAKQAADAAAQPRGFQFATGKRARAGHGADENSAAAIDAAQPQIEFALDGQMDGVKAQLGEALQGLSGDFVVPEGLAGLKSGLDLRKLPEADRWQKAKDDLGLSWNQVEDLKKAVADRDAAMKDAMTVEKKAGPNGGSLTIQRSDPGKTAHAEADYHDRVNAALNDDQKKKDWQSKGYDHAFGSSPFGGMGGSMVMSIDVQSDKQGDPPKDARK